ncbi:MAG: hypothetical protein AAB870_00965 [Patescibacteria group bacterium]
MDRFIQRFTNVESQITQDLAIRKTGEAPMEATRKSLFGKESIEGTHYQYREVLKEFSYLRGDDKIIAEEKLGNLRKEYKEYIHILELDPELGKVDYM